LREHQPTPLDGSVLEQGNELIRDFERTL